MRTLVERHARLALDTYRPSKLQLAKCCAGQQRFPHKRGGISKENASVKNSTQQHSYTGYRGRKWTMSFSVLARKNELHGVAMTLCWRFVRHA